MARVDEEGEEREVRRNNDCEIHPKYLVTPNAKFIEHSKKYFSRMFNNERYAEMLDRLSQQIYEYYYNNLEV
ncbi:unnamed protein product [Strongylus vulgaris]|uniref:Uncharacterized protein n=1 Tax=Strongylus vulgaris TaxID=40348 RepID=A0A3P7K251_STRVU|nr:unnamed protein product [Strongylus vulgaris]